MGHDRPDRGHFTKVMALCSGVMQAIVTCPKPAIAEATGIATGAGCQLVASCDLAIAAETAEFSTLGVHIGLFCSTPMVALSRNVASKHAMEMLLTGDVGREERKWSTLLNGCQLAAAPEFLETCRREDRSVMEIPGSVSLLRLMRRPQPIPVVRLSGIVAGAAPALFRRPLSLAGVSRALDRAFAYRSAPVVALVVNSPGGSAVQSHLIFQRIRTLSVEKRKPVLAFVEDVAASGGYMIACAADEIFADPASIVGSIGVLSQGFGFHRLLERAGVERRIYRAGENKAMLDPFQPEKAEDVAHLQRLQEDVHASFIELVRERRGSRLAETPELFSGLFWSGSAARDLGLVDQLGELRGVLRQRYGENISLRLIQPRRGFFPRRAVPAVAAALVQETAALLEERALWGRYGL